MRDIQNELAMLRAATQLSFFSSCKIGVCTETVQASGDITKAYVEGSAIDCGAQILSESELIKDGYQQNDTVIRVRLPLATVLTTKDRISSITIFGTAVTGAFGIDSIVIGLGCKVVTGKRIEV